LNGKKNGLALFASTNVIASVSKSGRVVREWLLELVQDQTRVVRRACEYVQNGRTRRGMAILAMLGRHGQDARATRLSVAWPSWPCWADTGKMPVSPDFTLSVLDNSLVGDLVGWVVGVANANRDPRQEDQQRHRSCENRNTGHRVVMRFRLVR
jgi:hypothetical protein